MENKTMNQDQPENKDQDITQVNDNFVDKDKLIYEASTEAQTLERKDGTRICGACERTGIPIFLARKSVVPSDFGGDIDKSMISLGDREPEIDFKKVKYCYRMLREGYVYVLVRRIKGEEIEIITYEMTQNGALRQRANKDIKGTRPKELPPACISHNHQYNAFFVTIDNRVYDKAWIAYSQQSWKKETVSHYMNNAESRSHRFSEVDLTKIDQVEAFSTQGRSFGLNDFLQEKRQLLEYSYNKYSVVYLYPEKVDKEKEKLTYLEKIIDAIRVGSAYGNHKSKLSFKTLLERTKDQILNLFSKKFYTSSYFRDLNSEDNRHNFKLATIKYKNQTNYRVRDIPVVVVEDSFGLLDELAHIRRQYLAPITDGLSETVTASSLETKNIQKTFTDIKANIAIGHQEIYRSIMNNHISKSKDMNRALFEGSPALARTEVTKALDKALKSTKDNPLNYFDPLNIAARKDYQSINDYKEMLANTDIEIKDTNAEAYLFLFFHKSKMRDSVEKSGKESYRRYLKTDTYFDKKRQDIDNIYIADQSYVVGLQELGRKLGMDSREIHTAMLTKFMGSSSSRYYFCKNLSLKGLVSMQGAMPLGDYEEIGLTDAQQTAILKLFLRNRGAGDAIGDDLSVKLVNYPNIQTAVDARKDQNLKKSKWDQNYMNKIHDERYDSYAEKDKDSYQDVQQYIDESSHDYLYYMMWLFGESTEYYRDDPDDAQSNKKSRPLHPDAPKTFNLFPFWRIECLPDSSDSHVNYLWQFNMSLETGVLGTFVASLEDELWALLLNNKRSFYYQILGDISEEDFAEFSLDVTFWNAMTLPDIPKEKQNDLPVGTTLTNALFSYLKLTPEERSGDENNRFYVLSQLFSGITQKAVAKFIADQGDSKYFTRTKQLLQRKHFSKSIIMASGGHIVVQDYTLKVPIAHLPDYLETMKNASVLIRGEIRPTIEGGGRFSIKTTADGFHIPYMNSLKFSADQVAVFKSPFIFSSWAKMEEFEKKYVNGGVVSAEGMRKYADNILEISGANLNNSQRSHIEDLARNSVKWNDNLIRPGIVAGSIVLTALSVMDLIKQLGNDKTENRLIYGQIATQIAVVAASATEAVIYVLKQKRPELYAHRAPRGAFANSVIKRLGQIATWAALIDSALLLYRSIRLARLGNSGQEPVIVASSIATLLAALGVLNIVPGGQFVSLVLLIFLSIFIAYKAYTGENFNEMQKWLNRCLFGRYEFADKHLRYYLNDPVAQYLSRQDYTLFSQGGECKLEYHDAKYLFTGDDLYLTLNLPNFTKGVSYFEGEIHLEDDGENAVVGISHGEIRPDLTIKSGELINIDPSRAPKHEEYYDLAKKAEKSETPEQQSLDQDTAEWEAMMRLALGKTQAPSVANDNQAKSVADENQPPKTGLFQVIARIGNVDAKHAKRCYIRYYPTGKPEAEDDTMPFIYSYYDKIPEDLAISQDSSLT